MKKWIKRIVIAVVLLVLLAAGSVLTLLYLKNRKPDWYPRSLPDAAAIEAAAHSMENKFADLHNWAVENPARERAKLSGRDPVATDSIDPPEKAKVISLSEAELNAFFSKWDKDKDWSDKYEQYLSDPVLVLQDGRIILAANVREVNTLVSVHFDPKLDETGKLRLEIAQIMGGSLPLPRAFWTAYRDKFDRMLEGKIDQDRKRAKISPDGTANDYAVGAAMNRLLLHSLNGEPSEPVLFLPQQANWKAALPVRLTDVKIKDKTITLSVESLTADERQGLLERIREPVEHKQANKDANNVGDPNSKRTAIAPVPAPVPAPATVDP